MDKDNNAYSLRMSAEEICVLAGILNYPVVFGVKFDMPSQWKSELSQRIKAITKRLEQRNFISIGLEGNIAVNAKIRKAITALCSPNTLIQISDDSKRNDENTIVVLKKGHYYVTVIGISTSYKFYVTNSFYACPLSTIDSSPLQKTILSLPESAYETAFDYYRGFDEEKALLLLREYLNENKEAELLCSMMSSSKIIISVYQNTNCLLICLEILRFRKYNNILFLEKTVDGTKSFISYDSDQITAEIMHYFERDNNE